ncbi:MAG: Calx-beta domain-containing protein [Panacagrimonas sp.]
MSDKRNNRRSCISAAWAAGWVLSIAAGPVLGADGDRVASFGTDGIVRQDFPGTNVDSFFAAGVQANGDVLTVGFNGISAAGQPSEIHIRRFTANGILVSGTVVPAALPGRISGAGISAAGEIVVVGADDPTQVQVRKFNDAGVATAFFQVSAPNFTVRCEGRNVVFDGNKIVVPCQFTAAGLNSAALLRFNGVNLTLDSSFGNSSSGIALGLGSDFQGTIQGRAVISDGSGGYYLLATVVDAVGGNEGAPGDVDDALFVQRFNAAGQVVTTYGNNGVALVTTESQEGQALLAESLFLDRQNRLLVGGSRIAPPPGFERTGLVERLLPNGAPDGSFGVAGAVDPFDDLEDGRGAISIFADSSSRLHILTNGVVRRVFDNGALEGDPRDAPGPFVFRSSRIASICCPTFDDTATWQSAVVVDGGNAALLLGGVDQFRLQSSMPPPTTAIATMAKIDLGRPPTARFTTTGVAVGEGVGTVNVGLQLSAVSTVGTTLSFGFSGGAKSPLDFTLPNGNTVLIPAGQTAGSLAVQVVNDALDEKVKKLNIALNGATANNLFSLTINDNDPEPDVSFDRAVSFVSEGGQAAVLVRLSAPSGKLVSVPFTLAGTANPANDYSFTPSTGILFFNPGQTEKFIRVRATAGDADNRKESVVITLDDPETATLGAFAQRTVFINP